VAIAVRFQNVSKLYQLGLTRTSFPSLVSELFKRVTRRTQTSSANDDQLWALHDVSFNLERGKSLALIGSNGAGKSTTLKLLAGITQPTYGNIEINGKLSALIELGAGFHPDLTGRENVYLNGSILGLSRTEIQQRFDEIVAFSELERFIDTPVKRYSSGMIVRLGFAVASCIEPEILLVDEVLAVGDAAFKQKSMKRIRSLINRGTSIVFVSHNFYLVQAVCQSAIYLDLGKVKFMGDTKDAIDLYERDLHQRRADERTLLQNGQENDDNGAEVIQITHIKVLDAAGNKPAFFHSDEPAQIRIYYNARKTLGNVNVSTFLKRSDGITCCMMRTKLDDFKLNIEQGQGVVTVYVEPLQLVGGSYFAQASFLNESDSMVLAGEQGRSEWFVVKGKALSSDESSGVYEPKSNWSHHINDTPNNVNEGDVELLQLVHHAENSRDKTTGR
jgi:lipopolysaccharide transport system ATP-binding protein